MPVQISVGISDSYDAVEAFSDAALDAARGLDGPCDLCLVFAGTPHLGHAKWVLSAVHERLEPRHLIGCGAGGVVGPRREIEEGAGAVVWAASLPGAEITTHHLTAEPGAARNRAHEFHEPVARRFGRGNAGRVRGESKEKRVNQTEHGSPFIGAIGRTGERKFARFPTVSRRVHGNGLALFSPPVRPNWAIMNRVGIS